MTRSDDRTPLAGQLVPVALLVVFAIVLIRTAWASDDAYITFRVIDNWHNGFGLRWNPAERVQAYTHPLWLLFVAAPTYITREFFYTPMVLGIVLSTAAIGCLALRVRTHAAAGALVLVLALGSKAFVDYGTSGLENPLGHLLLIAFASALLGREPTSPRTATLAFIVALAAVNRLDSLLLLGPALGWAIAQRWSARTLWGVAVGFTPLLIWELFAVVYYGFPIPNTAYAKLATGIPQADLLRQGLQYLGDSLRHDPITLVSVAVACGVAWTARDRRLGMLALGIVANLTYVVWIGGDFMSGRFLTPAFFAALIVLARLDLPFPSRRAGILLAAASALALLSPTPPLFSGRDYAMQHDPNSWTAGINDERRWYFQWSGWLREDPHDEPRNPHALRGFELRDQAPTTARFGAIGFMGFNAGPNVHIVDHMALCDPLLSRLPADSGWRIGHYKRLIPRGYMKSVMTQSNRIEDPELAEYYDALTRVVRGPLFHGDRWRAIWQLNSGALDSRIDVDAYRDPDSGRAVRP